MATHAESRMIGFVAELRANPLLTHRGDRERFVVALVTTDLGLDAPAPLRPVGRFGGC